MADSVADPWKSVSKPCSDVELTKALALLGFGSWTALEPSMFAGTKLSYFDLFKCIKIFHLHSISLLTKL